MEAAEILYIQNHFLHTFCQIIVIWKGRPVVIKSKITYEISF